MNQRKTSTRSSGESMDEEYDDLPEVDALLRAEKKHCLIYTSDAADE